MESVELVLAWEEKFNISIPDESAETFETPRDVGDFVERVFASENKVFRRSDIDESIKGVVIEQIGISESAYGLDVKFVAEMGVD